MDIECQPVWQPVLFSLTSAVLSEAPTHFSLNSNSLFLSDSSPPPNILIFSLVTFLLCQLPSPSAFSPLHLVLLALSYTFYICMPLLSPSSSLCSIPFFLFFIWFHCGPPFMQNFSFSSFVFSYPYCHSFPFLTIFTFCQFLVHLFLNYPSSPKILVYLFNFQRELEAFSFLPTWSLLLLIVLRLFPALSLQHAASSLLLLLYSSQQWMSDLNLSLCITALPFCSSGIPSKTNSMAATLPCVPSFVGVSESECNWTCNDKAGGPCILELQVHQTWLCLICVCMWEPVCWKQ